MDQKLVATELYKVAKDLEAVESSEWNKTAKVFSRDVDVFNKKLKAYKKYFDANKKGITLWDWTDFSVDVENLGYRLKDSEQSLASVGRLVKKVQYEG
jgi:hypothetical protein